MGRRRRRLLRRLGAAALGAAATLVVAELVIALAWRGFAAAQHRANLAALRNRPDEVRVLCMGESTTAVAGDEEGQLLVPRTAYPAQLERVLNSRQDAVHYTVFNAGIMGGTSGTSLELLAATLPELKPHVIVAMMGIKDTPREWNPLALPLPAWLQRLHTVKLLGWLLEDARLEQQANVLHLRSLEELPEVARKRYRKSPNQIQELAAAHELVALDHMHAAAYLLHIGQLAAAEELLREVVAEHGVGSSLLAEVLFTRGAEAEALALLQSAAEARPQEALYWSRQAHFLRVQGKLDAAAAVLEEALARAEGFYEPELARALLRLEQAELALETRRWDAALELVQGLPATPEMHQPNVPDTALLAASVAGRAHLGREDWEAAETYFLEALELAPERHVNMWLLSEVYRRTGQTDKEEALRWQLIRKEGRVAEYFELAKLFRQTGHPERVPEVLQAAVEATPSLAESYRALYDLADQHGVQLVLMQYPSFPLEMLQTYAPPASNVVYIDNEHLFEDDPERYYVQPTYPQSFTHYTEAGAGLMAERVAEVILELGKGVD